MADTLCGASNSLNAFKKHTSIDRTLQQDRIAAGQPSAEGFRSLSAITGVLDAEFEAFQSGHPLQPGILRHETFSPHMFTDSVALEHVQPEFPTWAADFQNLQLADARARTATQSQPQEQELLQYNYEDFRRQQAQFTQLQNSQQQKISNNLYNNNHFQNYNQWYPTLSTNLQNRQDPRTIEALDNKAFERAFDDASLELRDLEEHGQKESTRHKKNIDKVKGSCSKNQYSLPHSPIGSDQIINEASKKEQQQLQENSEDELARTAGELLDNIKHEHRQKYIESNFFSLMRQLRDREVRVEDDKFVDAVQPLHPGGVFYPDESQDESVDGDDCGSSDGFFEFHPETPNFNIVGDRAPEDFNFDTSFEDTHFRGPYVHASSGGTRISRSFPRHSNNESEVENGRVIAFGNESRKSSEQNKPRSSDLAETYGKEPDAMMSGAINDENHH